MDKQELIGTVTSLAENEELVENLLEAAQRGDHDEASRLVEKAGATTAKVEINGKVRICWITRRGRRICIHIEVGDDTRI
jgi:hypothetical protein